MKIELMEDFHGHLEVYRITAIKYPITVEQVKTAVNKILAEEYDTGMTSILRVAKQRLRKEQVKD